MLANAPLEKLADGFRWTEGPVWFADLKLLLFSDVPNDRVMRWSERGGVEVFREPSNFENGHTRDREGRLISCSHGDRCVHRTEHDGRMVVLADRYRGKVLNSPNDVVVKSDGSVWFTDPLYGIQTDYAQRCARGRRRRFRGTERALFLARREPALHRRHRRRAGRRTGAACSRFRRRGRWRKPRRRSGVPQGRAG
jgi:sugar lactone lactonase YvrE